MGKIDRFLNKRTMILGDVKSGKTARTAEILRQFLQAGYAEKIAVLDMAPDTIRGIGGQMERFPDEPLLYLTADVHAPRLMGENESHARQLAEANARAIEKLFLQLRRRRKEILFVNDTTLYLQAGTLKRLLEILNTASTPGLNAYYGSTFPDSTLSRRETQLTEELMKTCDQIIYGNGA